MVNTALSPEQIGELDVKLVTSGNSFGAVKISVAEQIASSENVAVSVCDAPSAVIFEILYDSGLVNGAE